MKVERGFKLFAGEFSPEDTFVYSINEMIPKEDLARMASSGLECRVDIDCDDCIVIEIGRTETVKKYEFASDFHKRILKYFKEHASDEEVLEYFRLPKKDQFKWMMEWNEQ